MSDRLVWRREEAGAYVAHPAGGKVELWWRTDTTQGPPSWMIRITCGETLHLFHSGQDRQSAADQANLFWPNVLAEEQRRAAEAAERAELRALIDESYATGGKDVAAFKLESATTAMLTEINWHLKERNWLGAMKPLAMAVSAELFRRRVGR